MTGRIQEEIRQSRPMPLPVEAHLNLQRTAAALRDLVENATQAAGGLRQVEFNVLRILRGAGSDGLLPDEIRARLLADDPMLPAVLGHLANRRLIARAEQRRVITDEGRAALSTVDAGVDAALAERMRRLSDPEVRALIDLLERLRA